MFQTDLLKEKRILVTGGGSGLGRAISERFATLGADLVLCGRRGQVLEETAKALRSHGKRVHCHTCDLRDPEQVQSMLAAIWAEGPLDVLVNNAAGNFAAPSESLSHRALDAVLGVVLHGTAYVTMECGKRWLAECRPANVLSIVTTYASTGSAFVLPSAMGKAGVVAMTRSLAVEWGRHSVRLNALAPGPFPTRGATERLMPDPRLAQVMQNQNPLARFGNPEELANLAAFMVCDQAGYLNGEVITLDGGEWLQGAGQFNFLLQLTREDWMKAAQARKG